MDEKIGDANLDGDVEMGNGGGDHGGPQGDSGSEEKALAEKWAKSPNPHPDGFERTDAANGGEKGKEGKDEEDEKKGKLKDEKREEVRLGCQPIH